MKKLYLFLMAAFIFATVSSVNATTMDWRMTHTWAADMVITFGVGDVLNPDWSTVIQNRQWRTSSTYTFTPEADSHLWDNTWWLKFDDRAYWDVGVARAFNITVDDGTVFSSANIPLYLPDRSVRYAYIQMPSDPNGAAPVPEPATMLLFGTGLAGIVGFKTKKKLKE